MEGPSFFSQTETSQLIQIRDQIEAMTKFNQVEVLRILKKHASVTLNENKYGVHINMTELDDDIIDEVKMYINYVQTQEINLSSVEIQKENFKNIYFTKDNKEKHLKNRKYAGNASPHG
jgi:hypothetical protein